MAVTNGGVTLWQGRVLPAFRKHAAGLRGLAVVLSLLLAALACLHAYSVNFNHIYRTGPYLSDTGWYIGLFRQVDILLADPPTIGSNSYFNVHFSPVFVVLSAVRAVFDADLLGFGFWFFAGVSMLVVIAPLALAALTPERSDRPLLMLIAGFGCVAWAMSKFVGGFFGYPHPETIYGFLAPVGFVLVMRGHRVAGALLLAALLLFREDMGFHIFSFAFLTYLWLKISKGDPVLARRCLVLSVAVFLYSLAALYIQKHYFVADNALARIYLGSPPLAHLNAAYLWQSLSAYVTERPAMAILPAVCVIMAICFREPAYLIGAVAVAPWVMLNAIAIAPAARSLSLYYAFPLLLTAVWPLVASTLLARRNRRTQQLAAFALFALVAFWFTSSVPRNSMADLRDLAAQMQSGPDRSQTSLFADLLLKASAAEGDKVFASAATASLTGLQIAPKQLLDGQTLVAIDRPDTVVTFFPGEHGFSDFGMRLLFANRNTLQFGNTPILIAYDRDDDIRLFRQGAAAAGVPLHPASLLGTLMRGVSSVTATRDGRFVAEHPTSGTIAYGPYLNLPKGRYHFEATVETTACAANPCIMNIIIMARGQEVSRTAVQVEAGAKTQIGQDIAIDTDEAGQRYENAVLATSPWTGQLSGLRLTRLAD